MNYFSRKTIICFVCCILFPLFSIAKSSLPEAIRFRVNQDGMVKVAHQDFLGAGIDLKGCSTQALNLYLQGSRVPILLQDLTPEGCWQEESSLIFWGDHLRDSDSRLYHHRLTYENAYLLKLQSSDPPCRYQESDTLQILPDASSGVNTYRRIRHYEEDRLLEYYRKYEGYPTDRAMWMEFKAPPREGHSIDLPPIQDLAETGKEAAMTLFFWGSSFLPLDPDHHWKLLLNEQEIGQISWDGQSHCIYTTGNVFPYLKSEQPNRLSLVSLHEGMKEIDAILLDWIELEYPARTMLEDECIELSLPPLSQHSGMQFISQSGEEHFLFFNDEYLIVYPSQSIVQAGPDYSFCLEYPSEYSGKKCRVVNREGFISPVQILSRPHIGLTRIEEIIPEYLIITHPKFMDAIQPLVKHREQQGLRVRVVDVDSIYDDYSGGVFSPQAIRDFMDDLLERSEASGNPLNYLFLVGDASYDYFRIRNSPPNDVPTFHFSENIGWTPSQPVFAHDDYFVYGKENSATPQIAVGRFPCNRAETLENFIRKIIEFERPVNEDSLPDWIKRAILISAAGYEEVGNRIAQTHFQDWETDIVCADLSSATAIAEMPDRIVQSINKGCGALYFVGHGAYYMWKTAMPGRSCQDMLTFNHIDLLNNRGKYPIVFVASCFSSLFDAPLGHFERYQGMKQADNGIGVFLAEAADRGAIAVIAHVGKASDSTANKFLEPMMDEIFTGQVERLGDAFYHAKKNNPSAFYRGMALIGDPATYLGTRYRK